LIGHFLFRIYFPGNKRSVHDFEFFPFIPHSTSATSFQVHWLGQHHVYSSPLFATQHRNECDHAPLVRAWDHSDVGRWEQEAADGAHERLNMAMFSIVCLCGVYCLLSASILALTVRAVSSFCSHMSVCVYVRCCICDTFCFHPFLLSNSLVLREAQFRAEIFFA
jgi:hypothetical protein